MCGVCHSPYPTAKNAPVSFQRGATPMRRRFKSDAALHAQIGKMSSKLFFHFLCCGALVDAHLHRRWFVWLSPTLVGWPHRCDIESCADSWLRCPGGALSDDDIRMGCANIGLAPAGRGGMFSEQRTWTPSQGPSATGFKLAVVKPPGTALKLPAMPQSQGPFCEFENTLAVPFGGTLAARTGQLPTECLAIAFVAQFGARLLC